MSEDNRLLPDGVDAIYLTGGRFMRFDPLDCDPKLLKRNLCRFEEPRLAGVAVSQATVTRYAEYMRMDEDTYLNRYLALVVMEELEALLAAGGVESMEHVEAGSYFPAGSYRVVCKACGAAKYMLERGTVFTHGVGIEEFTREFKCPRCLGDIRAERIETPVYVLGSEVYEVK